MNRTAKTVLDAFGNMLSKETLDRNDLELMIRKIRVFENHLEIESRPEIAACFRFVPRKDTVPIA